MLYHPDRFLSFAKKNSLEVTEFCKSRKGRSVPCLHIGEGDRTLLLTARHHACESTGSYVLEGVLEELIASPLPNTRILCVPFVDYDGVIDGDQGKARAPHDHNRDYAENIYPEVAAICRHINTYGCNLAFDFHSPWHKGNRNDHIYIVRNRPDRTECYDRFSAILESKCTPETMKYEMIYDYPANTGWNKPSPNFSFTMNGRAECELAFTLESTYFGVENDRVSQSKLIALGHAFVEAVKDYLEV